MYNSDPRYRYDGPEFDEYCISEGGYLPASRDRTTCLTCPLSTLCQAGFEEQIRHVLSGINPSLTEGLAVATEQLTPERLLAGLTDEQRAFVTAKLPQLNRKEAP